MILRLGDRGPNVARLQEELAFANHNPGPVDGVFGRQTDQAVRSFQQRHGLLVDGVAGPRTWAKLEEVVNVARPAQNRMLTPYFNEREFACRHCGLVKLHPELVQKLQMLRDRLGRPITIASGYRCPTHNRAVGGAPQSQHLLGTAADITVGGLTPAQVAAAAEQVGFGGIGRYGGFVHVDVRPVKARWNG